MAQDRSRGVRSSFGGEVREKGAQNWKMGSIPVLDKAVIYILALLGKQNKSHSLVSWEGSEGKDPEDARI